MRHLSRVCKEIQKCGKESSNPTDEYFKKLVKLQTTKRYVFITNSVNVKR